MARRYVLVAAVIVYLVSVLAGTVYTVEEILGLRGSLEHLAIGGVLLVLCGPVVYWVLRWPSLGGTGTGDVDADSRAVFERQRLDREALIGQRVAELAKDSRKAQFIPLVRSGRLLTDEQIAARLRRMEELQRVPHRSKYAPKVLEGAEYTDAQIDYLEIPGKRMLCEHLQPVEAAVKQDGVPVYYLYGKIVEADAILNWDGIRQRFALPEQVQYVDIAGPDNHYPFHGLHCTSCDARLNERGPGELWPPRD